MYITQNISVLYVKYISTFNMFIIITLLSKVEKKFDYVYFIVSYKYCIPYGLLNYYIFNIPKYKFISH